MAASTFQPKDPNYAARAHASFAHQGAMQFIGAVFATAGARWWPSCSRR